MEVNIFDVGDVVICDLCGKDYTNSNACGGIIFGSKAVCPECLPEFMKGIKKYNEQHYIKATCPENVTFKDFILKHRSNVVQIFSWDNGDFN